MMKLRILRASFFAASCLAAVPAIAGTVLAQVTGIYVELESGLRVERSGRAIEAGMPLLAEVRLPGAEGAPVRSVFVRMNEIDAAVGDQVEINLGESGMLTGVRPTRPFIVRVESHETLALTERTGPLTPPRRSPLPFLPVERPPLPQVIAQRDPLPQDAAQDTAQEAPQHSPPGLMLSLTRELGNFLSRALSLR